MSTQVYHNNKITFFKQFKYTIVYSFEFIYITFIQNTRIQNTRIIFDYRTSDKDISYIYFNQIFIILGHKASETRIASSVGWIY